MTEYIKPGKAAEMLGVSRDSIQRYVASGALEAITTPGGQRRIDQASVENVIQSRRKISTTVTVIRAE